MKPGWQSSEFWITLAGQLLALLALTGAINVADKDKLETALANAITAVFIIMSSTAVVLGYIKSRSDLKSQVLRTDESRTPASKTLLLLTLTACLFWAGPLPAAPPSARSCITIGQKRSDPALKALLQQLAQNQQTIIALLAQRAPPSAQPMILVMPAPPTIPLGGQPRQDIPIGQPPRQDIPLGGQPRQDVPIGQPPRQEVPLGPGPRQEIPLGPSPGQRVAPGESKPLPAPGELKPAPSGMTQYLPR